MHVISQAEQIRAQVQQWHQQQNNVAIVPTMGHLHAGHLSLIELAQKKAAHVIATIFVNPLQFNQAEDLANYPRSLNADLKKLEKLNVDAVFTPQESDLYPEGLEQAPRIHIPQLGDEFCGQFRPDHFAGVCTVVAKLFNLISPDIAIFGSKDYQQFLIIKRMAQTLNFAIEVIAGDTQREADGLALSSRNSLLSTKERSLAPKLYQELCKIPNEYAADQIDKMEEASRQHLNHSGFQCEYFAIRDAGNLQKINRNTTNIVVLAAAWLGSTRLIDNVLFPNR